MNNIIVVGGSKGGVGKSIVSMAMVDWYQMNGRPVFLIETDTSNPDVGSVYQKALEGRFAAIDLDVRNGWLDTLNLINVNADGMDVIINTAARNNISIREHGEILNEAAEGMYIERRRLLTIWPINTEPDGIELLADYMETMTNSEIFVFRNIFFDRADRFSVYNNSNLKKKIEETGRTYDFPQLAKRAVDELREKRITISEGFTVMPAGNKIELSLWQRKCANIFIEIIGSEV